MTKDLDVVDALRSRWGVESPDLDTTPWSVIFRIHRLERLLSASHEEVVATFGIAAGGFDVLAHLRAKGPPYRATPSDLASALLMSPAAMSNRIDRLAALGFVRREVDTVDRRSFHIELTQEGWDLVERAMKELLRNRAHELRALSESEQATLATLLRKLLLSLEDDVPTPRAILAAASERLRE